jgi:hypothetical protein
MSDADQPGTEEKRGRIARLGGYFGRRVGNPFINRVGRDTLYDGANQARGILRPERVSRSEVAGAIRGRYDDGGRARFAQVMAQQGVPERDLPRLEEMRVRQFYAMCAVSLLALCLGAAVPFLTDDWLIMISGLIFGLFSLVFLAVGLRHDFAAWQIRNRRFGGIREYVEDRWGR